MPYLQFDADFRIPDEEAAAFQTAVADLYAKQMDADASYTAVAVRDDVSLFLGRADSGKRVVVSADIREGRSEQGKRDLALALIDLVHETFDVPTANLKVVFTEHAGHQMMGADRVGDDWDGAAGQ
jgi:phenylpyruvate tautomerase PptA (4-oxalocrotonate tautomerase family)